MVGDGVSDLGPDVTALLATYDGPEPARVRSAIVALAGGDAAELAILVAAARRDHRDVLWWEQRERLGSTEPPIDVERLALRLGRTPGSGPVAEAQTPTWRVELLDPGPGGADVIKAVRAVSGLGLAAAAALLRQTPVTVITGLGHAGAEAVRTRLVEAGAAAQVHEDEAPAG